MCEMRPDRNPFNTARDAENAIFGVSRDDESFPSSRSTSEADEVASTVNPLENIFDFGGEQMTLYLGLELGDLVTITLNK